MPTLPAYMPLHLAHLYKNAESSIHVILYSNYPPRNIVENSISTGTEECYLTYHRREREREGGSEGERERGSVRERGREGGREREIERERETEKESQ